MFYDTGITVSELYALHLGDLDRTAGIVTIRGKRSKERRMALGHLTLHHLHANVDRCRSGEEKLSASGTPGEDHLFLTETRLPLTKNGIEMLFVRLRIDRRQFICEFTNIASL